MDLGSESQNLPSYVLLNNDWIPNGGYENFASAFLPASHAATLLRAKGATVDNINPADKLAIQRRKLRLLAAQDKSFAGRTSDSVAIESAIRNYETAFRMQSAIPEVASVADETEETLAMYGVDSDHELKRYYSLQCLRARRLVERGVRFIEITCPLTHSNNSPWDQHGNIKKYHEEKLADYRPGGHGPDHRSEASRTIGSDDRNLGWRNGSHTTQPEDY